MNQRNNNCFGRKVRKALLMTNETEIRKGKKNTDRQKSPKEKDRNRYKGKERRNVRTSVVAQLIYHLTHLWKTSKWDCSK